MSDTERTSARSAAKINVTGKVADVASGASWVR
jgi:hypothetical protein